MRAVLVVMLLGLLVGCGADGEPIPPEPKIAAGGQ